MLIYFYHLIFESVCHLDNLSQLQQKPGGSFIMASEFRWQTLSHIRWYYFILSYGIFCHFKFCHNRKTTSGIETAMLCTLFGWQVCHHAIDSIHGHTHQIPFRIRVYFWILGLNQTFKTFEGFMIFFNDKCVASKIFLPL